jgi:CDP-diacylglycerol--glycerol-3-phosphate 3-phosphatidyltransferase
VLAKVRHTLAQRISKFPAMLLAKAGISPNALTVFGFTMTLGVAWVLSTGHFFLGGFLVLLSGSLDFLDGALARATGRSTKFGAFLDSTLDRFSDAALFLGLLAYYASQGSHYLEIVLIGAALTGSLVTSYTRARAEGLGLKDEVGVFTRTERIILLAIGLIIGHWHSDAMTVVLWIIAVLSNLTALQRIYHVWRQTGGK